jgi:hypothetical protein
MFLVLLGFGAVLSVAGIALAGAGLSLREGTFDASLFTPGIIAAIGGLLLIGLGLVLRTLQQIERTLAARAMPRAVQMPIAAAAGILDESGDAGVFAFPPQTKQAPAAVVESTSDDEPAHAVAEKTPAAVVESTSDDEPAHAVAEKTPDTARFGNRSYPPQTKPAASASNETNAETDTDHFGRRGNGSAATRIPPRLPIGARSTSATERSKSSALDATWRKGSPPVRGTQPQPVQNSGAPAMEPQYTTAQAAENTSAPPPATAYEEPVPISVLRSGVVDGMAYTLYSDGSIEAQLPQGTLRLGSIKELRQHLEQGA